MSRAARGVATAFFENAKNYDGDECLHWPFAKYSTGRGQVWTGSKKEQVHRLICAHVHGAPPTPKHEAAHNCGNGHLACITKKHLRWATRKENESDKIRHGTNNRGLKAGEAHPSAKLRAIQVEAIRSDNRRGAEIAREYGVSENAIYLIRNNKTWKSLLRDEAE